MIMSIFKCVLTLFWTLPSKLKWVKHYWIFSKKVYHTFSGLRTFTSFFSQWHPCGIFFLSLNQEVLIYSFPRSDQGGQSLKSSPPMEQPPLSSTPQVYFDSCAKGIRNRFWHPSSSKFTFLGGNKLPNIEPGVVCSLSQSHTYEKV